MLKQLASKSPGGQFPQNSSRRESARFKLQVRKPISITCSVSVLVLVCTLHSVELINPVASSQAVGDRSGSQGRLLIKRNALFENNDNQLNPERNNGDSDDAASDHSNSSDHLGDSSDSAESAGDNNNNDNNGNENSQELPEADLSANFGGGSGTASSLAPPSADYEPEADSTGELAAAIAPAIIRPSRNSPSLAPINEAVTTNRASHTRQPPTTTMKSFSRAPAQPEAATSQRPPPSTVASQRPVSNHRHGQFLDQPPVESNLSRRHQQQAGLSVTVSSAGPLLADASTTTAFDMSNSDRLLIKPHYQRPQTMLAVHPGSLNALRAEEMATESVKHELVNQQQQQQDKRQSLLYPSNQEAQDFHLQQPDFFMQQQQQQQIAGACYTPVALFMVILVTMMATILICFCTHILIRHLSRRQFDLIENGKHFDRKHESSRLQQEQQRAQNQGTTGQLGAQPQKRLDSCPVPAEAKHTGGGDPRAFVKEENGFAFDNPYFINDNYLHLRQQQQFQEEQEQVNQARLQREQPFGARGESNLHFIESRISNLHTKQVTSSFKELTIVGNQAKIGTGNPLQALKLENADQRNTRASNHENQLVSVDITGQDLIGLGFDICGDGQDGSIYVKSVQTRGPARDSGQIEPGDRIKCLNISFDNITLQDAYDLLNCASPYKMRLLLEKQALISSKELNNLRSTLTMRQIKGRPSGNQLRAAQQTSATKTYIKRLTKLVSPASTTGYAQASQRRQQQLQRHQVAPPACLGSNAARQHLVISPSQFESNSSLGQHYHQDDCGQAASTIYSNQPELVRGQFSSDSEPDMLGALGESSANEGSLDYPNQSALSGARLKSTNVVDLRKTSGAGSEFGANREKFDSHLEQSQSQPEIAGCHQDLEAAGREREQSGSQAGKGAKLAGRGSSSASTPTINLLLTTKTASAGKQDWRRISSRRQRRGGAGDANEEQGSLEASLSGDSTSKLVEARQARKAGGTNADKCLPDAARGGASDPDNEKIIYDIKLVQNSKQSSGPRLADRRNGSECD